MRARPPGWILHRVRCFLDGRHVDHVEASVTFADSWWSDRARYVGLSNGWHTWARPPESAREAAP